MKAREKKRLRNRDEYSEQIRKILNELSKEPGSYPSVDFNELSKNVEEMLEFPPDLRVGRWLDKLLKLIEHQKGYKPPHLPPLEYDTPMYSWLKEQRLRIQNGCRLGLSSELHLRAQLLKLIGYDFGKLSLDTPRTDTHVVLSSTPNLNNVAKPLSTNGLPDKAEVTEIDKPLVAERSREGDTAAIEDPDDTLCNEENLPTATVGENLKLF